MLIATVVASLAAAASAIIAVTQARSARRSELDARDARNEARAARDETARLAGEANEAFRRQASAQERANTLKEKELTPPPWTGPRWVSGEMYSMTNTTGRTVVVDRFDVEPDEAVGFMRIYGAEDKTYKFGDLFEFVALKASGMRPRKLTIFWHFENEPDAAERAFIVPL